MDALADWLRDAAAREGVDAVAEALICEVAGKDSWRSFPDEIRRMLIGNGAAILAELEGEWWLQADAAALATIQQPALLVTAADSPPEFHEPIEALAQMDDLDGSGGAFVVTVLSRTVGGTSRCDSFLGAGGPAIARTARSA